MNLPEILKSGRVERFHAVPGVEKQTIAAHSWGLIAIIQFIDPDCRKELLLTAAYHDCAEIWTGDVPFHVKKFGNPDLKKILDEEEDKWFTENRIPVYELDAEETALLKVADCIEGMSHCESCLSQGQEGAMESWKNWLGLLERRKMGDILPSVHDRINYLIDRSQDRYSHYFRRLSI